MGFPRQEHWSGLPFPFPEDLPGPGIEPMPLHWQENSLSLSHLEAPIRTIVQLLSHVWLFATPKTEAHQSSLSSTISLSLLKFMSIELVMPSSHLILCCSLLHLPSIFCSIRVFSNESAVCIRWQKYWSFSFSVSPSRLISLRTDWLDLLAVQGTPKSSLQHHSSITQILWHDKDD